jgi:hypothetical protein
VRERGIASAQEAASNTPLLAAGFFILAHHRPWAMERCAWQLLDGNQSVFSK